MKRILLFVLSGSLLLGIIMLCCGCNQMPLLNPKGPIGESERFLIIVSFALMLIVVIPVIIMSLWFPWKYRAGNIKANHDPQWNSSRIVEVLVWSVPTIIVLTIAILVWIYTHKLDPYKPIDARVKPVNIEAISLDWKWLFIYPEEHIAVINQICFPVNVPLSFRITSATVMTSLFIPQLGSQIYAMAGMQTRLNLLASEPGVFDGQNQQFSGAGYSDMQFKAIATSRQEFDAWVIKARLSQDTLSMNRFHQIEKPTIADAVSFFGAIEPCLFNSIIQSYAPEMKMESCCNTESGDTMMHMQHNGHGEK